MLDYSDLPVSVPRCPGYWTRSNPGIWWGPYTSYESIDEEVLENEEVYKVTQEMIDNGIYETGE